MLLALEYGFRISLKSSSVLVAATFTLSTCLRTLLPQPDSSKLRLALGSLYTVVLSFLFYARMPYYEQFHMGFNQLIFNTLHDDVLGTWRDAGAAVSVAVAAFAGWRQWRFFSAAS